MRRDSMNNFVGWLDRLFARVMPCADRLVEILVEE